MTGEKHTPGPWHVDPTAPEAYYQDVNVLRHSGLAVAVALHNGDIAPAEVEANARLIAAAPDLLEVAMRILERGYVSEHIEEERGDHLALVAAIAKATGRAALNQDGGA